jgi:predicted nucleic acid-binding protein
VILYLSDAVLAEIREIPDMPTPRMMGVTTQKVETLVALLMDACEYIGSPVEVFVHPIDADDSAYVNLALAAETQLIVSRDRHLLNLTNPTKPWSAEFRARFPYLRVESPEWLLRELVDQERDAQRG